jgi:HSP20 family protein
MQTTTEQTKQNGVAPNDAAQAQPRKAEPKRVLAPSVDVYDSPDGLLVLADVPGVAQPGLSLTFENGSLSLSAERPADGSVFKRTFTVPEDIDPEAISAEITHGVLTIRLGRRASAKPRTIAVRG